MTKTIKICTGNQCSAKGSQQLLEKIAEKNPSASVESCPCQDNCQNGPTVVVSTPEKFKEVHSHMDEEKITKLCS